MLRIAEGGTAGAARRTPRASNPLVSGFSVRCRFRAGSFDAQVQGALNPDLTGNPAITQKPRNITNKAPWTAQALLALLFVFAGTMNFLMPAEKMQSGPIALPLAFIYFIGVMEVLGG